VGAADAAAAKARADRQASKSFEANATKEVPEEHAAMAAAKSTKDAGGSKSDAAKAAGETASEITSDEGGTAVQAAEAAAMAAKEAGGSEEDAVQAASAAAAKAANATGGSRDAASKAAATAVKIAGGSVAMAVEAAAVAANKTGKVEELQRRITKLEVSSKVRAKNATVEDSLPMKRLQKQVLKATAFFCQRKCAEMIADNYKEHPECRHHCEEEDGGFGGPLSQPSASKPDSTALKVLEEQVQKAAVFFCKRKCPQLIADDFRDHPECREQCEGTNRTQD
jgi:hypothetical protein